MKKVSEPAGLFTSLGPNIQNEILPADDGI